MNDELAKRIREINEAEKTANQEFEQWVNSNPYKLTSQSRQRAELIDYVAGLNAKIGDLREILARTQVGYMSDEAWGEDLAVILEDLLARVTRLEFDLAEMAGQAVDYVSDDDEHSCGE